MKKFLKDLREFYTDKCYLLILTITAVCAYGFLVTHPAIGIDDTPYEYYFEEGLAAIVGRWVMFLLNKVVHVAEFVPFITDFAGVLILMAAVTVWAALFRQILDVRQREQCQGKHLAQKQGALRYAYLFFAVIFLSCPLISEVYTYFLHNGIAIGYLCCGISIYSFREGLERLTETKKLPGWPAVRAFLASAIAMWIAMGCYESFMIVWLQGICLMLLSERFAGMRRKIFRSLCIAGGVAVLGMLLRSVMIQLVTALFGLEYLQGDAVQRSIMEMAAWVFEPGAFSELAMVLKRMFVMYGVFAYAYYPIKIFLLAMMIIGVFSVWRTIKNRDVWTILLMLAGLAVPLLLAVVECKATFYRSAQFLPVVCGYGALIAVYAVENGLAVLWGKAAGGETGGIAVDAAEDGTGNAAGNPTAFPAGRITAAVRGVVGIIMSSILWNQCTDMNKWFYLDYQKYEAAKEYTGEIAHELEKHFDTAKPVIFTGEYEVPYGIVKDAYVPFNSETFYDMKRITDRVDEHLLDKFYRSYGVWVAQTPALSVIDWGRSAFDSDAELVRFFAMHGYEITPMPAGTIYEEAELYAIDLPDFPQEGSIVDMGDYILVNL